MFRNLYLQHPVFTVFSKFAVNVFVTQMFLNLDLLDRLESRETNRCRIDRYCYSPFCYVNHSFCNNGIIQK